jgi:hypothetical protein
MNRIRTLLIATLVATPLLAIAQTGTTPAATSPSSNATTDKTTNATPSTTKPKKVKRPRRPRGAVPGSTDNYPSAPNGPAPKL